MPIGWVNGPTTYAGGLDRNMVFDPKMVRTNVGYYGDPGQANPVVGEIYTAHLVVGVGYPARGGVVNRTRIRLPPNTTFDFGLGIRCYRQRPGESNKIDSTKDSSANCPQKVTLFDDGSYDLGERDLVQGNLFEIEFDLQTTAPMSNGLLTGFIDSPYGMGPLSSSVPVAVFPAPPPPNFNGTWFGYGTATEGAFPPGRQAPFRLELEQSASTVTMAEYDDWTGGGFPATPPNQGKNIINGRQVTISTVQAVVGDSPIRHTWTLTASNNNRSVHFELRSENPSSFPFPVSRVVGDLHK
jgi:hypothetical protein